jgi:hypothetical protein
MTREEAKLFVKAFVKLRELATDEMSLQVPNLYPTWRAAVDYATGDKVLYNDVLYKVLTAHTSQDTWAPDVSPSLFARVLIHDDNIILEWIQPDSTNAYKTGDKVIHNGQTWTSIVDNNVWEPGNYGWQVI